MSTTTAINAKDLTKQAPRSPREKIHGYIILARSLDKGRAAIAGTVGDYHFDCPLDNFLFGFKEVKGADIKQLLVDGASDETVATWLDNNGAPKTADEIKAFGESIEAARPYDNPEKKEWFAEQCATIGIDPATNTLFDWLEADDKFTFSK